MHLMLFGRVSFEKSSYKTGPLIQEIFLQNNHGSHI